MNNNNESEHQMYRAVDCPEMKSAKRLCLTVGISAIAVGCLVLSTPLWIQHAIRPYSSWLCVGIAIIMAGVALRASLIQSYWNKHPWEQPGAERPGSHN